MSLNKDLIESISPLTWWKYLNSIEMVHRRAYLLHSINVFNRFYKKHVSGKPMHIREKILEEWRNGKASYRS